MKLQTNLALNLTHFPKEKMKKKLLILVILKELNLNELFNYNNYLIFF